MFSKGTFPSEVFRKKGRLENADLYLSISFNPGDNRESLNIELATQEQRDFLATFLISIIPRLGKNLEGISQSQGLAPDSDNES